MQIAPVITPVVARSDIDRIEALIATIEGLAAKHAGCPAASEAIADARALRRLLHALPHPNVAGFA